MYSTSVLGAFSVVLKCKNTFDKSSWPFGFGGIRNGEDAFHHILAGASAVQVGSQFKYEGFGCFKRITDELAEIMKQKKYECISDFKGKLNYI